MTEDSIIHVCWVCGDPDHEHPERCYEGPDDHDHYPPLCCPGCPCRSFEGAHPETLGTPLQGLQGSDGKNLLSTRTTNILLHNNILTMEELAETHLSYLRHLRGIGTARFFEIARVRYYWRAEHFPGTLPIPSPAKEPTP